MDALKVIKWVWVPYDQYQTLYTKGECHGSKISCCGICLCGGWLVCGWVDVELLSRRLQD